MKTKLLHLMGAIIAICYSLPAQANRIQNIPIVSLRAYSGQLIGWDPTGWVNANKSEISEREFFRIYNISRPDILPQSNDIIVLQASNGQFLFVRDDGRIGLHPDYFNSKVRFQVTVLGRNDKGDLSCQLKSTATNKFVMAANGGGAELNNNALQPRQFETFTFRFHEPVDVFIKNGANNFLSANTTGYLQFSAGTEPPANSSFSFIVLNRSHSKNQNLISGDTVVIRYRYKYVAISGDGRSFYASSEVGNRFSQFIISSNTASPSNPRINNNQPFSIRSIQSGSYWLASGMNLTTSPTNTSAGNNFIFWQRPHENWSEAGFPSLPSGITSYPFRVMQARKAGIDSVVVFKLRLNNDFSIDDREISNRLFGAAPSLSTWLRDNSNGRYNVASKGIFGPFQLYPGWSDQNYDTLFTLAENSGLNLNIFGSGIWDQAKYKLLLIEPGSLWGNAGFKSGTSRRGYRFAGNASAAGVTPDVDKASRMVMAHEISHTLLNVTDRYPWRRPLTGDVMSYRPITTPVSATQKFVITRKNGNGQVQPGDQVSLKSGNRWVITTLNAPFYVNIIHGFSEFSWFTLSSPSPSSGIVSGSKIYLQAPNNNYLTALQGGNSAIMAQSGTAGDFETFTIQRLNDRSGRPVMSGDTVILLTHNGLTVEALPNSKEYGDEKSKKRGYQWIQSGVMGCGGLFDNSTSNYDVVLLNLYDRIRLGWVNQQYLTPDMKGTYLIRPYIGSGDGIILFDPMNPREWYTVENRVKMENRDEIPSSGLIISWVCEDEEYWRSLYSRNRDDDFSGWRVNFPVIISANNPRIPPNPFFYPPLIDPNIYTMRNSISTAFCSMYPSHELVLPLGNGSPSRFHIIISKVRGSDNILLTIK